VVVEDGAEGELVTGGLGQSLQAAEVGRAYRSGRFHLDPDDAATAVLDDDVDFSLVLVAIVAEAESVATPAGNFQELREDEFKPRPIYILKPSNLYSADRRPYRLSSQPKAKTASVESLLAQ
jgi:hypothetical protein